MDKTERLINGFVETQLRTIRLCAWTSLTNFHVEGVANWVVNKDQVSIVVIEGKDVAYLLAYLENIDS